MITNRRRLLYPCLLLLALSSLLSAQVAPIGILKVESGEALLDGRQTKLAKLVYQGQKLELAAGSSVVFSFLGNSGQVRLTGPLSMVMDPAVLEPRATKVQRGELRLSREWLRVNKAGGGVTRTPVYLDPQLPPRQVMTGSNLFELVFLASPSVLDNRYCRIELFDPSVSTETAFFSQMCHQALVNPIIRTSAFIPGQEYLLKVSFFSRNPDGSSGSQTASYTTSFRYLTQSEESALKEFRERQMELYGQGQRVEALVALADMYGALGQNHSALTILTQLAGLGAELDNYPALQTELTNATAELNRSVRMPLPSP